MKIENQILNSSIRKEIKTSYSNCHNWVYFNRPPVVMPNALKIIYFLNSLYIESKNNEIKSDETKTQTDANFVL